MNSLPDPLCCSVACGEQVSIAIPGPQGPPGENGTGTNGADGKNTFTTLSATCTQPAVSANVTATVLDNTWAIPGENAFVQSLGTMSVVSKSGSTSVVLKNLGYPLSAAPGTVAGIGALVGPTGERGAVGATGSSGSVGATGPAGPKGDAGSIGPAGPAGSNGSNGISPQCQLASTATASEITSTIPFDDTIPQNTEGLELLTVAITPTANNTKLVIEALIPLSSSTTANVIAALFKDAGADAIAAMFQAQAAATYPNQIYIVHEELSGSVVARTYKLRIGNSTGAAMGINGTDGGAGVARKFGGVLRAWLKVTEFAA